MAKNMRDGPNWIPGIIVNQLGPVTYLVEVSEGRMWKRHVDHIKDHTPGDLSPRAQGPEEAVEIDLDIPAASTEPVVNTPPSQSTPSTSATAIGTPTTTPPPVVTKPPVNTAPVGTEPPVNTDSTTRRYPARERHPPLRFADSLPSHR